MYDYGSYYYHKHRVKLHCRHEYYEKFSLVGVEHIRKQDVNRIAEYHRYYTVAYNREYFLQLAYPAKQCCNRPVSQGPKQNKADGLNQNQRRIKGIIRGTE